MVNGVSQCLVTDTRHSPPSRPPGTPPHVPPAYVTIVRPSQDPSGRCPFLLCPRRWKATHKFQYTLQDLGNKLWSNPDYSDKRQKEGVNGGCPSPVKPRGSTCDEAAIPQYRNRCPFLPSALRTITRGRGIFKSQ